MIEQLYSFALSDCKTIERIVEDDYAAINHMILGQAEALPEHNANSNVYMIIVRGRITLRLDDQSAHQYAAGSIVAIPFKTKMNVSNQDQEVLEFFVIKAPSPKNVIH
jgi:quercetin dioxygenase-like cupin family protein